MKKISELLLLSIAALLATSCNDDSGAVTPAMISNLQAEPQEGAILLTWDNPTEGDYLYAQVQYVDPLTNELKKVNVSHFADEYLLSGLYQKNGAYTFKVYSVSSTGTVSSTWEEVSATALRVPPTVTAGPPEPIQLSVDMLSSDFTEPQEGSLANLIDGNPATYWACLWSSTSDSYPQWIQIDLKEPVQGVKIKTTNRATTGYTPSVVDIQGSNDGVDWTTLGSIAAGTIPDVSNGVYETPVMSLYPETGATFTKIRYTVNKVVLQDTWPLWCMAEIELSKVSFEVIDPEA
ncbi:hypothetical protein B5G09_11410 [Alistipes sp. An54]|uniref:discoidin domain-containing protein n=1 Tax=Alistipes sp. An54 TaxID=1965645 RepID=UPI000B37A1F2|nr:discoidin domain-containing protein [Alistipes sp. An54]OUN76134.1 hypothetical protein B5G09_11410 [Alistipes sp. An54]